jgi:Vacuolar protein sorting-associated protein 26
LGALTGTKPVKIDIHLTPPEGPAIVLDHRPSWKLHKNPFWRVKHPQSSPALNNSLTLPKDPVYVFAAAQDIAGTVVLRPPGGSSSGGYEHLGVSMQLIGRIDMNPSLQEHAHKPVYDFMSVSKELLPPGVLSTMQPEMVLPFRFKNMDKEFESYTGRMVAVRYILRVRWEVVVL